MITHMFMYLLKNTGKIVLWLSSVILILSLPSNSSVMLAAASTNLHRGDLAVIGINSDGPGVLALLALTDIKDGTVIFITDHSWDGNALTNAENLDGVLIWTADSDLPRGTVLTIKTTQLAPAEFSVSSGLLNSIGWYTTDQGAWGGGFGDSLIIYQGSELSPDFIYAFTNRSDTIDRDPLTGFYLNASANKSTLPIILAGGGYSNALTGIMYHQDNLCYSGTKSGTKSELLMSITDTANWTGNGGIGNTAIDFHTTCGPDSYSVVYEYFYPLIYK